MLAVSVLLGLVPVLAVGGSAASAATPRALLVGQVCQAALDPPARAVSVTAVMRPVTGTKKLQVEFQLLERAAPSAAWAPVAGPGLGVWLSPTHPASLGQQPSDVWFVKKPVADLNAPASYRFEVTFRWLGSGGGVLQTTTRLGRVCRQPELRPDLAVESISVVPGPSGASRAAYLAVIENLGLTGAGPFTVELSEGGSALMDKTVVHLAAHASITVKLDGPACNPTQPPTVTVDPTDQVDVYSRAQATLAAQCTAGSSDSPAAAGTPSPGSGLADGIPVSG